MTMKPTTIQFSSPNSSKSDIALQSIPPAPLRDPGHLLSTTPSQDIDPALHLPHPSTTVSIVERWNHPRKNIYRTCATIFAFIIMGANDAAYGAIIPYLETYYDLSYIVVSLVFLSPLGGYVGAALLNNWIHVHFGQRGVAFLGPVCHLAAYIGIALHPPYPVLVVIFILAGFGNGIEDAGWNAWAGNLANANEVLGFLHGAYGLGAVLSPLAATTLMTKGGWAWYQFYYIMVNLSFLGDWGEIHVLTFRIAGWRGDRTGYLVVGVLACDGQGVQRTKPPLQRAGGKSSESSAKEPSHLGRIHLFTRIRRRRGRSWWMDRDIHAARACRRRVRVWYGCHWVLDWNHSWSTGAWIRDSEAWREVCCAGKFLNKLNIR